MELGFRVRALVALLLATAAALPGAAEPIRNGFDLSGAAVPAAEILAGGPGRDGIPALDEPRVQPAGASTWNDDALVLGIAFGGEARAYPIAILDWHELVNDTIGGQPILVSYCPLCGTGLVFDRRVGGEVRRFGVSGLLYRSDVLMYDRGTESLWSQISSRAVTGPLLGSRLRLLRSRMESFGAWKRRHPDSTVLSRETGHDRDYERSPYRGYAQRADVPFPVPADDRYHAKMPTVGLRSADGAARGYPASELVRAGGLAIEAFGGAQVQVRYDDQAQVFSVDAPDGVEVVEGYWFAWAAFHPDASVFSVSEPGAAPDFPLSELHNRAPRKEEPEP